MSDTPETDANDEAWAYNMRYDTFNSLMDNPLEWDEFARKLERERDEAIAEATNAVNDIIGVRWKLNSLAEACQNLIDVKGRHNTEIAFNKMKSILESITSNE
jgi:ppGpp synthetase/RelA/SpoT-type nucleotidyltranferase